jgi:hypothetical protein
MVGHSPDHFASVVCRRTLQALVRKYFAIRARVSRSSSTTRMFGAAGVMPTFVGDSWQSAKYFCF